MNKTDLIDSLATATGLAKKDAANAVDGVFTAITEALKQGDEVRLVGFGTFSVSERAATKGAIRARARPSILPPRAKPNSVPARGSRTRSIERPFVTLRRVDSVSAVGTMARCGVRWFAASLTCTPSWVKSSAAGGADLYAGCAGAGG